MTTKIMDSGLRTQDSGLRTQDSGLRTQDSGLRMNYALMDYISYNDNLGDEIQSIAASRFLPRIDYYVCREELNVFHAEKVKIILNGWFMSFPDNFPPTDKIDPLLISFYINPKTRDRLIRNDSYKKFLLLMGQ